MEWALAIVHPCSWRSNSSDRSRFDWRRNKGYANGRLALLLTNTMYYLKTYLEREGSLRLASHLALVLVMK